MALLRQHLVQTVDIPVPLALLQSFTPGQSSKAPQVVEQNVDFPTRGGCLQGLRPGQGSAAPSGADIARLDDFSPGHDSTALLDAPPEHSQGFFLHFSRHKKCEDHRAVALIRWLPSRMRRRWRRGEGRSGAGLLVHPLRPAPRGGRGKRGGRRSPRSLLPPAG